MAMSQILWSLENNKPLSPGALLDERELEELLHKNIDLLDSNWLVIGRQVKTSNGKYLDILCIDRDGDLVVVELKKDLTPREVTAQVIEYASYMAEKKPEDLAQIYLKYAEKHLSIQKTLDEAYREKFGVDLDEEQVNQKIKMVIVATKMDNGTEHIIQYLRETYHVDINILFFQVFQHGEDRLLSRIWFEEDLELEDTAGVKRKGDWNNEYYVSFGSGSRMWEDAMKYGFISAGGGTWYTKTLGMLHEGDRVWVNIPHVGYVGVGIVSADMQQASQAMLHVDGKQVPMSALPLDGEYFYSADDSDNAEFVVPITWVKTVPRTEAVKETGFFGNQNTVCRPQTGKWQFTIDRLKKLWGIQ